MCVYAQQWTKYSVLKGVLVPRPFQKYGENLWQNKNAIHKEFMKKSSLNPVKSWYDQIEHYPGYYNPILQKDFGEFLCRIRKIASLFYSLFATDRYPPD